MGVIDENRRAEARAHALQPPWRALQFFQGREDARGLGPALDGEARRDERIGGLKGRRVVKAFGSAPSSAIPSPLAPTPKGFNPLARRTSSTRGATSLSASNTTP
jgi:hypothetical protein